MAARSQQQGRSSRTGALDRTLALLNPSLSLDFFLNLKRLSAIMIPGIWSKELGLLGAHTLTLVARTFLSIYVAGLEGRMVKHIVKKDKAR